MTVIIDKIYCILIPVKFKNMYYNYAIISSFTFEFLDNTQSIFTVNHCQSAFAMLFHHLSEIYTNDGIDFRKRYYKYGP